MLVGNVVVWIDRTRLRGLILFFTAFFDDSVGGVNVGEQLSIFGSD